MPKALPRGAVLLALAVPLPAAAPAQRLSVTEAGLGVATVAARRTFVGGEIGLGYRPGGQGRVALAVAGGSEAGLAAARGQLTAQFLVTPAARSGAGLYAGLGAAVVVRRATPGRAYLALLIGVENAPGRRGGSAAWYVEVGVGGGVRAAAGWRVRRFPRWWR